MLDERSRIDNGIWTGLALHFGVKNLAETTIRNGRSFFNLANENRTLLAEINHVKKTVRIKPLVRKKCPEEINNMKTFLFDPAGFSLEIC